MAACEERFIGIGSSRPPRWRTIRKLIKVFALAGPPCSTDAFGKQFSQSGQHPPTTLGLEE